MNKCTNTRRVCTQRMYSYDESKYSNEELTFKFESFQTFDLSSELNIHMERSKGHAP